jgi:hypothetical protein
VEDTKGFLPKPSEKQLIAEIVKKREKRIAKKYNLEKPRIQITFPPMDGSVVTALDKLSIEGNIFSGFGNLDKVELRHNGKISNYIKFIGEKKLEDIGIDIPLEYFRDKIVNEFIIDVPLLTGKNKIELSVSNTEGYKDYYDLYIQKEKNKERMTLDSSTPKELPTKDREVGQRTRSGQAWAIIIGVSEYQHVGRGGLTNLVFAENDALDVAAELKRSGWRSSNIKVLTNEQATERNVRIALESWLTKAGPDDLILLYWSGHGYPDPDDPEKVYFACYDTDLTIPATGYRMDRVRDALEERGARQVVLMADTCHAGKLITRSGERGVASAFANSAIKERPLPPGWIFMVGADSDRQAIEHSSWANGAFTHCLLEGLRGKADGFMSAGPRDGRITMGEVREYLRSQMPDATQRVLGTAKHPVITTSSGDPDIWNISLSRGE